MCVCVCFITFMLKNASRENDERYKRVTRVTNDTAELLQSVFILHRPTQKYL